MDNYEIIYAADDSFAVVLGISLLSLFENNKDMNINITIFDSGISDNNKHKIEEIFKKYDRESPRWIHPINLEEKLSVKIETDRGSLAQYSRLYIQDYFESDVERILYLDCDTLIVGSIRELFKVDMQGKVIAGVKDAFSKYYRKNINLLEDDLIINSGVYIIDMKRWKHNHIEDIITSFIINKKGNIQQGDQGVLNLALNNNISILSPRYNLMSIFYEYSYDEMFKYRRPVNFYTKNEILEAKEHPVIIHYTSAFNTIRPWYQNSTHPLKKTWKGYYDKSPWRNIPLKPERKKGINRILFLIYNFLPKCVSLRVASVFQVYVRPLFKRFK